MTYIIAALTGILSVVALGAIGIVEILSNSCGSDNIDTLEITRDEAIVLQSLIKQDIDRLDKLTDKDIATRISVRVNVRHREITLRKITEVINNYDTKSN